MDACAGVAVAGAAGRSAAGGRARAGVVSAERVVHAPWGKRGRESGEVVGSRGHKAGGGEVVGMPMKDAVTQREGAGPRDQGHVVKGGKGLGSSGEGGGLGQILAM
eukprot:131253-Pelagomonas_calceolata.AAC.4